MSGSPETVSSSTALAYHGWKPGADPSTVQKQNNSENISVIILTEQIEKLGKLTIFTYIDLFKYRENQEVWARCKNFPNKHTALVAVPACCLSL